MRLNEIIRQAYQIGLKDSKDNHTCIKDSRGISRRVKQIETDVESKIITLEKLKKIKAPFFVRSIGKTGKILKPVHKIIGFSSDPIDGGFACVYFENGGWLTLNDFIHNHVFAPQ